MPTLNEYEPEYFPPNHQSIHPLLQQAMQLGQPTQRLHAAYNTLACSSVNKENCFTQRLQHSGNKSLTNRHQQDLSHLFLFDCATQHLSENIHQSSVRQIMNKWRYTTRKPNIHESKIHQHPQLSAYGQTQIKSIQLSCRQSYLQNIQNHSLLYSFIQKKCQINSQAKKKSKQSQSFIDTQIQSLQLHLIEDASKKASKNQLEYRQKEDQECFKRVNFSLDSRTQQMRPTKSNLLNNTTNSNYSLSNRKKNHNKQKKPKRKSSKDQNYNKQIVKKQGQAQSKKQILNKIKKRLECSNIFRDSKHANIRHEKCHLENAFRQEACLRRQLIDQITLH